MKFSTVRKHAVQTQVLKHPCPSIIRQILLYNILVAIHFTHTDNHCHILRYLYLPEPTFTMHPLHLRLWEYTSCYGHTIRMIDLPSLTVLTAGHITKICQHLDIGTYRIVDINGFVRTVFRELWVKSHLHFTIRTKKWISYRGHSCLQAFVIDVTWILGWSVFHSVFHNAEWCLFVPWWNGCWQIFGDMARCENCQRW